MALFEGELIGQFKLPEDDHRALVITDGNDTYTIFKAKDSDPVYDAEFWGLLAKGKDGHSPVMTIDDNYHAIIDGKDTGKVLRGPTGSMGITTELTGTIDLNTQTVNGFYSITSGTISNAPAGIGDTFTLLIYGNTKVRTQLLHGTGNNEVWIRGQRSGTWSDWRQITQWN